MIWNRSANTACLADLMENCYHFYCLLCFPIVKTQQMMVTQSISQAFLFCLFIRLNRCFLLHFVPGEGRHCGKFPIFSHVADFCSSFFHFVYIVMILCNLKSVWGLPFFHCDPTLLVHTKDWELLCQQCAIITAVILTIYMSERQWNYINHHIRNTYRPLYSVQCSLACLHKQSERQSRRIWAEDSQTSAKTETKTKHWKGWMLGTACEWRPNSSRFR